MLRAILILSILIPLSSYGDVHQRRGNGSGIGMWAPLTTDLSDERGPDGTLTRATASICDPAQGTGVSILSSGDACRSSTTGVRMAPAVTNKTLNSDAVNLWVANSTTVTADHAAAPDGTMTADRVQMNANGDYVRAGSGATSCTANTDIVVSAWVKSLTASCDVYLGNAYGTGFPAIVELITVPTTWTRVWTQKVAHTDGNCHLLVYRYDASATCTDFLVWEGQIEESSHSAPMPGCHTGGAEATCDAETLVYSPAGIRPSRGTLSMSVTLGDASSSDWASDIMFAEIDASSTWQVYYDESAGHVIFQAGGQAVTMAQVMASWTSYTVQVSWNYGMPLIISVDGGTKTYSGDNYSEPTWSGDLYLGSSVAGTAQGTLMISDVKGYTWYR